jgi:hypothetical protein
MSDAVQSPIVLRIPMGIRPAVERFFQVPHLRGGK